MLYHRRSRSRMCNVRIIMQPAPAGAPRGNTMRCDGPPEYLCLNSIKPYYFILNQFWPVGFCLIYPQMNVCPPSEEILSLARIILGRCCRFTYRCVQRSTTAQIMHEIKKNRSLFVHVASPLHFRSKAVSNTSSRYEFGTL